MLGNDFFSAFALKSLKEKLLAIAWLPGLLLLCFLLFRQSAVQPNSSDSVISEPRHQVQRSRVSPQSPGSALQPQDEVEGASTIDDMQSIATWAGTDIDGGLSADPQGRLIIDRQLRDFLDYMLSAVGDLEPEQVFDRIALYASQQLPESAVDELMALLDDYLAFKESAQALRAAPLVEASQQTPAYYYQVVSETLEELKLLRRTHMSAEAVEAFFADEEAYASYSLAKMRITLDPDLSPQQKQQQLDALMWNLPQGLQQTMVRKQQYQKKVQATDAIMQSDLAQADKHQQLSQLHSPAMADRIIQHESNKANWQQQFAAYQREQQLLLSRQASDDEQQALFERFFPTAQAQTIARTFAAQQQ